jgi:uncharacterized protein (TIGR02996 family)
MRGVTTWAGLVHAIRCDPEADAPRLAAAMWLRERGDDRGAYVERALVEPGFSDAEREEAWSARVRALAPNNRWRFTRGFLEELHFKMGEGVKLDAACALEPITRIVLRDATAESIRAAIESAALSELRLLGLVFSDAGELLASPKLAKLEEVFAMTYSPPDVRALAHGAIRPRIFELNAEAGLDVAATEELVDGGFFARIGALRAIEVDDEHLEALARAPLADLRELELSSSRISESGIDALGERLDQLDVLVLTDVSAPELVVSHMPSGKLRRLETYGFSSENLGELVMSPAFRGVEELVVHGPFETKALIDSPHRGKLRKVCLPHPKGLVLDGVEIVDSQPL